MSLRQRHFSIAVLFALSILRATVAMEFHLVQGCSNLMRLRRSYYVNMKTKMRFDFSFHCGLSTTFPCFYREHCRVSAMYGKSCGLVKVFSFRGRSIYQTPSLQRRAGKLYRTQRDTKLAYRNIYVGTYHT